VVKEKGSRALRIGGAIAHRCFLKRTHGFKTEVVPVGKMCVLPAPRTRRSRRAGPVVFRVLPPKQRAKASAEGPSENKVFQVARTVQATRSTGFHASEPDARVRSSSLRPPGLSIDVSAVSDLHDGHGLRAVIHFEEDSEVPLSKSEAVLSGEFFTPAWPRFYGEVLNLADDATPVFGLEILQLWYCRRFDMEIIVCHGVSDL